jgi:hypothetical protein
LQPVVTIMKTIKQANNNCLTCGCFFIVILFLGLWWAHPTGSYAMLCCCDCNYFKLTDFTTYMQFYQWSSRANIFWNNPPEKMYSSIFSLYLFYKKYINCINEIAQKHQIIHKIHYTELQLI